MGEANFSGNFKHGAVHLISEQDHPSDKPQCRCPDAQEDKLPLCLTPEVDLDEGLRRFRDWVNGNCIGEI